MWPEHPDRGESGVRGLDVGLDSGPLNRSLDFMLSTLGNSLQWKKIALDVV